MKKGRVKKKKIGLVEWILIGLVILAVLFLAFKIFITGNVVSKNPEPCSASDSSVTKTIAKNSANAINGLTIFVTSSHGINNYIDASLIVNGDTAYPVRLSYTNGTSNIYKQTTMVIGTNKYTIELVSATTSSATLKATSCLACVPKTCSQLGKTCGTTDDGCGTILNCGNCATGKKCTNNVCTTLPCLSKGSTCSSTTAKCCSNSCRQTTFFGRKWGSPHCK